MSIEQINVQNRTRMLEKSMNFQKKIKENN